MKIHTFSLSFLSFMTVSLHWLLLESCCNVRSTQLFLGVILLT